MAMTAFIFESNIPGHRKNWASSRQREEQNWLLQNILLDLGTVFVIKLNMGFERHKDMLTKTQKR